ncbi:hypothetical protein ACQKLP_17710 [Chitinophaga sp. NPDC101104]|uniref:hypothetical protein n=1 Tax=Chitinophaga sp. NPDC101104 TaxID=3390561 RepID=UPI003D0122EB
MKLDSISAHNLQSFQQLRLLHPFTESKAAAIVGDGLPFEIVEDFMDVTDLSVSDLCFAVNATGSSFRAWRDRGVFPKPISNIIMQLVEIYAYGYCQFGQRKKFNSWMQEPSMRLGMIPPMALISDEFGLQELLQALKGMEAFELM